MHHHHDPMLVLLSVAVSFLGAFTGLNIGARAVGATGWTRAAWIACSALALGGCAIWSMHFVGMLALQVPGEELLYEVKLTLLSAGLAIGFTGVGMWIVAVHGSARLPLLVGGMAMGSGVATMHYVGMAAIIVPATISYDPLLVCLAIGIAITAATAGLWLVFNLRSHRSRLLGAVVTALAVSGMHYTAMAGMRLDMLPHGPMEPSGLSPGAMVTAVVIATLLVVLMGLAAAVVDQRFAVQKEWAREIDEARGRAERAARVRQDFLATMSHEIRTPMTGILGMVDILATENLTAQQKQYVESIRASGRHLLNILNDILDFSRLESGRIELERIDFSLLTVLERLRALAEPLARERGVSLRFELDDHSPPVVRGDPTRLKQVLLNLVVNAIKFAEKGCVRVQVSHEALDEGYSFKFAVRDDGIGISAEQQRDLFTAFSQADTSTSRRYGGSGLGLAISQRLVTAMGGRIDVSSTLGRGSTFWFEIPLAAGDAAALPAAMDGGPVGSPCRVLVAEDVELNRTIIRTVLERDGHDVVLAHNGAEALDLVQRSAFDLVLMDVQMPVMDGVDATRAIRALTGAVRDIPIVALTANVMAPEQQRYLAAGMNQCLTKPIEWDRLRAVIAQYCPCGKADGPNDGPDAVPQPARAEDLLDADVIRQISDLDKSTPGLLANLMEMFVHDTEERLTALHRASEYFEADEMVRHAHAARGGAANMGAKRLADLFGAVEQEANRGDLVAASAALERLRDQFALTRAALAKVVTTCVS